MDLVELMKEKEFVGQDFLTWLWLASESINSDGFFEHEGNPVVLLFDYNMKLECGAGDACNQLIFKTASGSASSLPEIKLAVQQGKKISQAQILISWKDLEFICKLDGSLLELTGIKLPKTVAGDDEDGYEARILERIYLAEQLSRIIDSLFLYYLKKRLTPAIWKQELVQFRDWLNE